MTNEQLNELAEALSILSAKSSVLKERNELRALMEENLQAEEDPKSPSGALTKRIRSMLTKIDSQISEYDSRVGSSLQMISADAEGKISVQDLEKALGVIKHKPDDEVGLAVIRKLDVDSDGFVELEHVLGLVKEEGLGKTFHIPPLGDSYRFLVQASSSTTRRNQLLDKTKIYSETPRKIPNPAKRTSCKNDLI